MWNIGIIFVIPYLLLLITIIIISVQYCFHIQNASQFVKLILVKIATKNPIPMQTAWVIMFDARKEC